MLAYLDASAWVKRYLEEVGTEAMSAVFDQQGSLIASTYATVEVSATLARHQAPERIVEVQRRERGLVDLVELDHPIVLIADHFATSYRLRAGDAIHLATAFAVSTLREEALTMITSDAELADAARACGFDVFDPTAASE